MILDINKIKAIIFDMDGVIFDTEMIYLKVWSEVFEKYGYKMTKEIEKGVPLKLGAYEILEYLKENNFKIALATSAISERSFKQLNQANIKGFFDVVVCRDDVIKTKPNPEIFLKAANKLGVSPEQCIVIEDSDAGIEAAFNAGMIPIHIVDLKKADEKILNNSYKSFNDLNEIRKEIINMK